MSKFKVGDRLLATQSYPGQDIGDSIMKGRLYTVIRIDPYFSKEPRVIVDASDPSHGWPDYYFTLVGADASCHCADCEARK